MKDYKALSDDLRRRISENGTNVSIGATLVKEIAAALEEMGKVPTGCQRGERIVMPEYVLKEDVLNLRYHSETHQEWVIDACDVEELPAADVVPVKRGEWIIDHAHGGIDNCSICGEWCGGGGCSSYCPNCGAKMKG